MSETIERTMTMRLFKVEFEMPIFWVNYYVVASGYDEAVRQAEKAERRHDNQASNIKSIQDIGEWHSEGNLLIPGIECPPFN